jgi:hypothetical protein
MTFQRSVFSELVISVGLTAILVLCSTAGAMASHHYASDAVVARFTVDAAVLADVSNTTELVDALHQELKVEAASPMDFEVVVHMQGNVYQNREQPPHAEGSGIMLSLEKDEPVNDRIKDLRFYTYGDFSESEAWSFFRDKIQEALLYSMNSSQAFEAGDDGTVWLTVVDVVDGSRDVEVDEGNMILELGAELNYRDGSKFGSKEPPEGYRQVVRTVQLVLSPAKAQAGTKPEAEAEAEAEAEESIASADSAEEESDGLTGMYGFDQSGMLIEKIDGQYFLSNPSASETRFELIPAGESQFTVEYDGMPMEIKFSVDDNGFAFAINMTYVEYGNTIKLPRK